MESEIASRAGSEVSSAQRERTVTVYTEPASAAGPKLDVDLSYAKEYARVDPASGYVPVHVVGSVNGPDRHPRDIAIAVNGTIRGVGNTFTLAVGDPGELVSVMVPETAFRKGRNRVEVYLQQ